MKYESVGFQLLKKLKLQLDEILLMYKLKKYVERK